MNKRLTFQGLGAWLKRLQPDSIVGYSKNGVNCVLAQYMRRVLKSGPMFVWRSERYRKDTRRTTKNTPQLAYFVGALDQLHPVFNAPISAKDALAVWNEANAQKNLRQS